MKKPYNCVIIDDEPLAQELLERFIERVPYLKLAGKFDNAITALNAASDLQPDIIFLDVNMPEMTGIEFLDSFSRNRANVILTTAYAQFAVEGFEHNVVDYLLKPFSFARFMKGIQKVVEKLPPTPEPPPEQTLPARQAPEEAVPAPEKEQSGSSKENFPQGRFFMVKEDKKLVKINLDDIVFVEGMKDYIKIHLYDRFIVTHITMSRIDELLSGSAFIRINRSYIVKISFIKLIEGNMVEMTNGKKLPIGINYRDVVKDALQNWTL